MSRRFRRQGLSNYVWIIVLVLVVIGRYWTGPLDGPRHPLPPHPLEPGEHRVARVVDGDTLLIAPHERLRLIGVNAPETVKPDWPVEPWGPEASAFTKHFVAGGKVRLQFDEERLDDYGRYLAYVWVGDKMLNEELVRAGLARFEHGFHYSAEMKRRFRRAEDEARRKHLGIWSGRGGGEQNRPDAAGDSRGGALRAAGADPTQRPRSLLKSPDSGHRLVVNFSPSRTIRVSDPKKTSANSKLRIAVIGGDGTGPEVAAEGLKVLDAVSKLEKFQYETTAFDFGGERYLRTGETLPAGAVDELRKFDAIYLGAVGHPDVKPGILEKGLLLELRFQLDQYINLRPVKLFPGVETPLKDKGPADIDFVVVRENTEDLYCGVGGFLKKNTPDEVASQTAVYTRKGCERCIRWAFEFTRKRNNPKKMLTLVAKTNVLTYGHDLWWRTFQDVAREYPDIKADYNHVDACCMWMVKNPEYYDVIVTTNMFGDIITDLGGILQGGMGVAAGGNINPDPGGTSMYEPMGGSAPKYTGKNVINPIAAINAMSMLLEHTGQPAAGARVMQAIQSVTGSKMKSQAAGKMGFSTQQVGDLVIAAL